MRTLLILLFLNLYILNAQVIKNDLANETSPYLLQHATNPVHWMPWSSKAFAKAKKENKPIFLSIGYSTCHWCHVMEQESFTNKKIAKLLNRYFVSIKVDREEMPQLDSLYQNIYKNVHTHSGGWPLSVFMTPQKEVFHITTYIPPKKESYAEGFNTLLPKLNSLYNNKKELQKMIKEDSRTHKLKKPTANAEDLSVDFFVHSIKKEYDDIYIGFGRSRKFPEASKLSLMMDLAQIKNDKELEKDFYDTLDIMALRGVYDHAGGGFFRYSVDAAWEIPHFEKMLYNQAELIPLYARGYAQSHKKLYKYVVDETINMVEKRFAKNDLYFSASDADSDGEEGGFFTYTTQEIQKALQNNPYKKELEDAMGFSMYGNFKEKVHINFQTRTRPKGFKTFKKELLKIRKDKKYPFIDKKINTAWNAMMIEALYKVSFIDKRYAKIADKHLEALKKLMFRNGELYHQTILHHTPTQKGILEDYSFFIAALLASYETNYDEKNLLFAEYLLNHAKEKFYKNEIWYLSDDGMKIKAALNDKYYTSALSKMIEDIMKLTAIKASFRYEKFATQSLNSLLPELQNQAANAPALAKDYLMNHLGVVILKSNKSNLKNNIQEIKQIKYPYILTKEKEYDDFLACTIRKCFAKEKNLEKVIKKINSFSE